MSGLWKKVIASLGMFGLVGLMGCVAKPTTDTKDYLLCNDTSRDNMAEIESGFFRIFNEILYYADKENMTKWVPVCNKPDCGHENRDCNAYVGSEIAQKGEKLYCVNEEVYAIGLSAKYRVFVNEISMDGSGLKKVYEIPFEEGAVPSSYRALISSHSLVLYYRYLTEDGMYQNNIARLEENGTLYNLYSGKTEDQTGGGFLLSSSTSFVRGNEGIISDDLTLAYTDKTAMDIQKVLWRVDREEPELVPIPEDVSFGWCYLTDDYMIDYEGREGYEKGYYKYDFNSGEKTLLGKAEQDNAWGYMMTEDCVVESNRYLGQTPENPYLRIYYDGKWSYVPLPDVVAKASKDTSFAPLSIASDRIFFMQDATGEEGYSCRLYYVMLEDETPELTYCTTFGSDSYFDFSNLEQSTQIEDIKEQNLDITVFDTDEYFIQVTGIDIEPVYEDEEKTEDLYKITMRCENKTKNQDFKFRLQDGAINGVACSPAAGFSLKAGETKEHIFYVNQTWNNLYSFYDFTDIAFLVYESSDFHVQKIVHIYPQGEENVISHIRESEPSDKVLIDNEYVTVTIIGYENNSIQNDTVRLFIENKSDTNIAWMREGFPMINGVEAKQYKQSGGNRLYLVTAGLMKVLPPGVCAYESLELPSEFLQENGVTSIENFDVALKFWYGETWDEKLLSETYTITP